MLDEECIILEHRDIGYGYHFLVFCAPQMASTMAPGQFIHVKVPGLETSALRRPFSVFDAEGDEVSVLYKTVGRGTGALNAAKVGDKVKVLGPLGHGFPETCNGAALLVGGGFGVAPLHFLAKRLLAKGHPDIRLFVGGRTASDLLELKRFEALGVKIFTATNDGSAGVKGLVTDPLDDELIALKEADKPFELFACGPDGMLKAVALRATGSKARGWISMDRHMVCGVGACYACIQKTVRGNSRCCMEGPVFAAEDLVW